MTVGAVVEVGVAVGEGVGVEVAVAIAVGVLVAVGVAVGGGTLGVWVGRSVGDGGTVAVTAFGARRWVAVSAPQRTISRPITISEISSSVGRRSFSTDHSV